MLDKDLADFYEVQTKTLKHSVKTTLVRLPTDFMVELKKAEHELLRSKFDTSKPFENSETLTGRPERDEVLRCKSDTSKVDMHGGDRYLPYAFSKLGILMLSSVINTDRSIQVNITLMCILFHLRLSAENPSEILQTVEVLAT